MSLRPAYARWFELLTTREELTLTLEALAATGCIELETHSETHPEVSLQNLQTRLQSFDGLARRYQPYWPQPDCRPAGVARKPSNVLISALRRLGTWEQAALPYIRQVEALHLEQGNLLQLEDFFAHLDSDSFDAGLLASRGDTLAARLFVLAVDTLVEHLPTGLLVSRLSTASHDFLLAVGTANDLDTLTGELASLKAKALAIPDWLHGTAAEAVNQVKQRYNDNREQLAQRQRTIDDLATAYELPGALGDIHRLEWFMNNVSSLPVSRNFAWITGWTSDLDGQHLIEALRRAGANAVIHFPAPPGELSPPVVMHNPWWARPFEAFARMLGTPSHNEADPSRLLAIVAPLLFGYMFGDVGQGLVLLLAGALLQKRWPILRILIANGFSAVLFGFLFGSVFGREDILPALWVHPVQQPLPVLMVPLAGGVVIILLGLLLGAMGAYWRGEMRHWLFHDAAILVLYLSIIAGFFVPGTAPVVAMALLTYFGGALFNRDSGAVKSLASAAGELVETTLQLLINTISFVRVGAFALAHGGLSLAFNIMAGASDNFGISLVIILLGNLVVIALEGLVVSIQTTRLILFEFFIRFLTGSGRSFRPLAAPDTPLGIRRAT